MGRVYAAGIAAGSLAGLMLSGLVATTAVAEVRIGKNVRVGGNPVTPETFDAKRRGHYVIRRGAPGKPTCSWRTANDGSRVKVCHFRRTSP
ncbi:MAG TPA: hypothetical protein PK970_05555 [Hyphomicrobiaceae bacterium]|nr:hypothetical protein [Hyphomicrobiaceae bacterium]